MADLHFEILAHEMTPLGVLCLRRRGLLCEPGTIVTEVTLNHEFLMSTASTRFGASFGPNGLADACWRKSTSVGRRTGFGLYGTGGTAVGTRCESRGGGDTTTSD